MPESVYAGQGMYWWVDGRASLLSVLPWEVLASRENVPHAATFPHRCPLAREQKVLMQLLKLT